MHTLNFSIKADTDESVYNRFGVSFKAFQIRCLTKRVMLPDNRFSVGVLFESVYHEIGPSMALLSIKKFATLVLPTAQCSS